MTNAPVSLELQMAAAAALAPAPTPDERAARWRRHARKMQAFIMGSYCIDAVWMLILAGSGVIAFKVPLVFLMLFITCGLAFTVALLPSPQRHLADPYFTVPQILVASSIQFGFMLWVPQIGMLMLTVLFIIVGFGGLRLKLRQATFVSLWLAFGVCLVIGLRGEELSLPLASPLQRIVSALWISSAVARAIMLGQYGAQLRKALLKRNEALNRAMEVAERLASRDSLTGALNRASILKVIEAERQRMARTGHPFAVVLLDLDHFKRVNDGFGHHVGDQVLSRVVALITAQLRATDDLGRYGGEEFLMLLGGLAEETEARQVVGRILRAVQEEPWGAIAEALAVTTSAGVAIAGQDETALQIINRADSALYRAKNAGRNRLCLA